MAWFGILLLALALGLMMCTGWPTYAVLLGVCSFGAVVGLAGGAFDAALLGSLPGRVLGLLEHDLLQALALYALVGALLNRMAIADNLYVAMRKAIGRAIPHGAPAMAGLTLGALLAPMNGSVGASVTTLSKIANRHWHAEGIGPAQHIALVAVAGTLGVVVPPSIVLLLLGDAMLRAHTEGLNIARQMNLPLASADIRIVNSQDVMQAVLLPAAALLLGWLLIAAWRVAPSVVAARPAAWLRRERWALAVVPVAIASMLTLVTLGRVRAVEAAAAAGVLLLLWGLASRHLTRALLWQVLDDAMALTGALFALLVAATTFSLMMRALGSDRLVNDLMLMLQGHPLAATLTAMALLLACAFVLDAFELIFLVVPIVMPPLLAQVGDAAWVAVLALLVLQAGFLLPPFGYAVVLARGQQQPRSPLGALAAALAPYLAWLAFVMAVVITVPQTTRWLRTSPPTLESNGAVGHEDVEQLIRDMSPQHEDPASSPGR
jgi:TRAP-type mannitol/chloroaromatic compound transport system permease large subunit